MCDPFAGPIEQANTLEVSSILECFDVPSEHISIQEAVPSKTKRQNKLAISTLW